MRSLNAPIGSPKLFLNRSRGRPRRCAKKKRGSTTFRDAPNCSWVSAAARFAFSPRLLGLGAPGRENSTVTRAPAGSPKHAWGRVLEIHRPIFNRDAFPSTPFTFITYLGYRDSLSLGCSGIPLIGGKSPPTGGGAGGPPLPGIHGRNPDFKIFH